MTAPLPERIERAKGTLLSAQHDWSVCGCLETPCAHGAAFDQARAALDAAIRDALAEARRAALEEAAQWVEDLGKRRPALFNEAFTGHVGTNLRALAERTPDRSPT